MSLPPDPRVPDGSVYDRSSVISAVTNFYKLLSSLPYVKPEDVLYPPPEGWANIQRELVQGVYKKNDEVFELLKRLPYLNQERFPIDGYFLGPSTKACDFRQPGMREVETGIAQTLFAHGDKFPPWSIALAMPCGWVGSYAILDTSDGTITEYEYPETFEYEYDYEDGDPRAWRNTSRWKEEITDRTSNAVEYFAHRLGEKFRSLDWIGLCTDGDGTLPRFINASDEEHEACLILWPDLRKNLWIANVSL